MTLSETLERVDPSGMYAAVQAFPEHLAEGWRCGAPSEAFGLDGANLDGVVIGGMGGSAIGGDLLRTLAEREASVPVQVVRGYDLPGWVSERTLVVASSYSGGTEETRSLYDQAVRRGARIVAVTAGGAVLERARAEGHPHLVIPGGLQPRAALGYSLGALLRLGRAAGLLALSDAEAEAAVAEARERVETYRHAGSNPARDLAAAFRDRIVLVYSGTGLLEAVNLRWRTQLHENAKAPAFGNLFPELDHNEIMGFEAAASDLAARLVVAALRDRDDHPQVRRRIEATREIVAPQVGGWYEVEAEGTGRLSRMLSLIQLGDWVSFWLAVERGVDPTPVGSIQRLKEELARS